MIAAARMHSLFGCISANFDQIFDHIKAKLQCSGKDWEFILHRDGFILDTSLLSSTVTVRGGVFQKRALVSYKRPFWTLTCGRWRTLLLAFISFIRSAFDWQNLSYVALPRRALSVTSTRRTSVWVITSPFSAQPRYWAFDDDCCHRYLGL